VLKRSHLGMPILLSTSQRYGSPLIQLSDYLPAPEIGVN
jgi:hypothetical protein